MKSHQPAVSVVMPVYNGGTFLREAMDSVLRQTLSDFELIVADDGSTDDTPHVIASYADPRIRLLRCDHHYIRTLNTAMQAATAPYIARMDADDRMLPERLEAQYAFMEAHPEISVCGSWFRTFGNGAEREVRTLADPDEVKVALLRFNPIAHPTVMMRRACVDALLKVEPEGPYRAAYVYAEDYYLWCELAAMGYALTNLPQCLLEYRLSAGQVTQRHQREMVRHTRAVQNYRCSCVAAEVAGARPQTTALWNDLIRLANERVIAFSDLLEISAILYRSALSSTYRP